MLYLIGIGLGNEKDLTLNALEIIKKADFVYLENYTSSLNFKIKEMEKLTDKEIIAADRNLAENTDEIVDNAEDNNVAFLVKGDVFSATTHADIFLRAKKRNIECKILHNASILTAIGDTGLSLYKFGKAVSIPFENANIKTPYEILNENEKMHTLILLDLKPDENKYMNFKEGLNYLIKNGFNSERKIVICAALGTDNSVIKYGMTRELLNESIEIYPQSIIVPGELHFIEEEMLNNFILHQQQ